MWPLDQYELIDFGRGRKLERFGQFILDRPSPAATEAEWTSSELWPRADIRLSGVSSVEQHARELNWSIAYEDLQFKLRVTPFGHVGIFPEHEQHWRWLAECGTGESESKSFLNLFAYTGGASLVMAAGGWQVAHVDAAAPTVAWARENAAASNLQSAPIRWLVEDARIFTARELKRGRRYDAILLDPPSYGHGPKGKAWRIEADLPELLQSCCQLLNPGGRLLLTGHSPDLPVDKRTFLRCLSAGGLSVADYESGRTQLSDRAGRKLDFGWFVRVRTC